MANTIKNKKPSAYTLVEILVCLAVLNCLIVLSVFWFDKWLEQERAQLAIDRLVRAVYFAQSSALAQDLPVIICHSANRKNCDKSQQGNWASALIIFKDSFHNQNLSEAQQVLKIFEAISGRGQLTWRGFGKLDQLQVLPLGLQEAQNGTFFYCPFNKDNLYARGLIINKAGRMRPAPKQNAYVIGANGEALLC